MILSKRQAWETSRLMVQFTLCASKIQYNRCRIVRTIDKHYDKILVTQAWSFYWCTPPTIFVPSSLTPPLQPGAQYLTANTCNKRKYDRGEKLNRSQNLVKCNQLSYCQVDYYIDSEGNAVLSFL